MLNLKPDPQAGYVLNTDAKQPDVLWNKFRGLSGVTKTLSVAVDWTSLEAHARSPRQFLWKKWTVPNPCADDLRAEADILGPGLRDAYRQILSIIAPQASVELVDHGKIEADVVLNFREISYDIKSAVMARTTFPVLWRGPVWITLDVGSTRWAVPGRSGWRERADPLTLILREAMLSMGFGYCRNPHSLTVHPQIHPGLRTQAIRDLPGMDRKFLKDRIRIERPVP